MIKGFLFGLLLVLLSIVGYLAAHLGFFRSVSISESVHGPYFVLFQNHTGAYYKISDTIMSVEQLAKTAGLDCQRSFGEYFDNPSEVDEDRLRSRGGCISENPYPKTPGACETAQIPAGRFVIAHFSGSPAIGPWKVYPAIEKYVESHRLNSAGNSIEIYKLEGDAIETEYLLPLK